MITCSKSDLKPMTVHANPIGDVVSELEARRAELTPDLLARVQHVGNNRTGIRGTLAAPARPAPAETLEAAIARFAEQYKALPKGNILAEGHDWEKALLRLQDPANAAQLGKVRTELSQGGRLFAVMEDGSLEFMDSNQADPPMFLKDKDTGALQIIFDRDQGQMKAAAALIKEGKFDWASIQEMLDWAEINSFGVFDADTEDYRWFGQLMKLAEAASPTKYFVGTRDKWRETALKNAFFAFFDRQNGGVRVSGPRPSDRKRNLGLLRRLRI